MRMIIDVDAGIDDAEAILMALTYPSCTVEAITTVTGVVPIIMSDCSQGRDLCHPKSRIIAVIFRFYQLHFVRITNAAY